MAARLAGQRRSRAPIWGLVISHQAPLPLWRILNVKTLPVSQTLWLTPMLLRLQGRPPLTI